MAMINTVSFPVLVVFALFGLLKCNANKTTIVIGNLASPTTIKQTKAAFHLALDVAKNSSDFTNFFENYEIDISTINTFEDPDKSVVIADRELMAKRKAIMILGPHTAVEATSVLHVVGYYKKLMVTFLDSTNSMSELDEPYGFTFTRIPKSFNAAKKKLVEYFNWTRVAVVYDFATDAGLYVEVVNDLSQRNRSFDIIAYEAINSRLRTSNNLHDTLRKQLTKLKDQDIKIFLGEFDDIAATLVFCQLYKVGIYGPEYVWILGPKAGTVDDWVTITSFEERKNQTTKGETCTKEQYQAVANRTFILSENGLRTDINTITDSGLSLAHVSNKLNLKSSDRGTFAISFDVMWAVIIAMKNASKQFPLALNTKEEGNRTLTERLNEELKNVSFEGLTGPMFFDEGKMREGITLLQQYQDGGKKLVSVGRHLAAHNDEGHIEFFNGSEDTLWKDNRVPSDRTRRKVEMSDIPAFLFIIFSTAATFGIVLGVIFLVFNRYYRKYKFVRLSAPLFNDIMVLGCISCLVAVFLFGLRIFEDPKRTVPRICKARAWILNIGFSLAYGAMFIKTWRIYKICTNKRLKVRLGPLSDWSMLAMVGGIILIDVATLVAWELADPLQHEQVTIYEEKDQNDPFKVIEHRLNICTATNLTLWLTLIYVYKGILLLYGLFLAYETRNVVYAHLNDSRVIGICVYNVVVLSIIGAFLAVILDDKQYKELYAALSVCIIFPATGTISLIFVPKLLRRLKMNSLNDETGDTTMHNTMTRPSIDISSIATYQGNGLEKEKCVEAGGSFTNTLYVSQNGDSLASLSPLPLPAQPTFPKDVPTKPLDKQSN